LQRQTKENPLPYSYREAALNWLALGLLLAAWNATDDSGPGIQAPQRPSALRGYAYVSVRAATRAAVIDRASP
jgi:hypothetical protein